MKIFNNKKNKLFYGSNLNYKKLNFEFIPDIYENQDLKYVYENSKDFFIKKIDNFILLNGKPFQYYKDKFNKYISCYDWYTKLKIEKEIFNIDIYKKYKFNKNPYLKIIFEFNQERDLYDFYFSYEKKDLDHQFCYSDDLDIFV